MIWIIGGTSESRDLLDRIQDLDKFIISFATEAARDFVSSPNLIIARMDYGEMLEFIEENKISLIINLAHPYASLVTENAKRAAREKNIKYIRYIREGKLDSRQGIYLKDYETAYEYIAKLEGNIFFTTGSKNIGDFEKIKGENRFIYRILPARESIDECRKYNISLRDIVAAVGPFSKEYNKIMFKEYQADYVVMKDSGDRGGSLEKIEACNEVNIRPIIIGREEDEGINNLARIEEIIRGHG